MRRHDFADYLKFGVVAVISKNDKTDYKQTTDLCGKRLGSSKGSATTTIVESLAALCRKEGKGEVVSNVFPGDSAGLLAVRSGRLDAHLLDSISANYEASTDKGKKAFRTVLPELEPKSTIYGFVIDKRKKPLTEAISMVLGDMIADGTYQRIFGKYGVADFAVSKATINAGGSEGQ